MECLVTTLKCALEIGLWVMVSLMSSLVLGACENFITTREFTGMHPFSFFGFADSMSSWCVGNRNRNFRYIVSPWHVISFRIQWK